MNAKIITVAQQKGGSGKTTIAANLALALSGRKNTVAILDTDPQGSLGRWFMERCERTGDEPGLGFRTASAWGARYEARELAKTHDYVIVDTPPKMGSDGRPAIEVADLVVVPVTPSPLDLWATEPTVELARTEKTPTILVINKAAPRTRMTRDLRAPLEKMNCSCANAMIGNRIAFAETLSQGSAPIERFRTSAAASEVNVLTDELEAILQKA